MLPLIQGVPSQQQGELVQTLSQLVLNCLADLLRQEGTLDGLKQLLAAGLQLQCSDTDSSWLAPAWKVCGQLPHQSGSAVSYWEYPYDASTQSDQGSDPGSLSVDMRGDEGEEGTGAGDLGGTHMGGNKPFEDGLFDMDGLDNDSGSDNDYEHACASDGHSSQAGWDSNATSSLPVMRIVTVDGHDAHYYQHQPQQQQHQSWHSHLPNGVCHPTAAGGEVSRTSASSSSSSDSESSNSGTKHKGPCHDNDNSSSSSSYGCTTIGGEAEGVACNGIHSSTIHGTAEETSATQGVQPALPCVPASQPVNITTVSPLTETDLAGTSLRGGTPGSGRPSSLSKRSFSRQAFKSYRVQVPPRVLMLHLKRFQQDFKGRLIKLDTPVSFDQELDFTSFVSAPAASAHDGGSLLYDLAGVVVHLGNMRGGHYVAYVKRAAGAVGGGYLGSIIGALGAKGNVAPPGGEQWYHISDSSVKPVGWADVAASQAYMLMYVQRGQAAGDKPSSEVGSGSDAHTISQHNGSACSLDSSRTQPTARGEEDASRPPSAAGDAQL